MARNIKLLIAYDGTEYHGWQRQRASPGEPGSPPPPNPPGGTGRGGGRTIQGEIEAALEKMHRRPVGLTGSGRTDAGVHALGQAANFYTAIDSMEARRFIPALNSLLPRDIRVLDAAETGGDFHARFDARSRTYRYFFIPGREALPMERRYALRLWKPPELSLLNAYCRLLRGELDCSLFASPADKSESRRRYLYGASFFVQGDKIVFQIRANAFLWKMVRSAAGTLLFYGEKGAPPEEFAQILASGRRELAGPVLPPEGLFLWSVEYQGRGPAETVRGT